MDIEGGGTGLGEGFRDRFGACAGARIEEARLVMPPTLSRLLRNPSLSTSSRIVRANSATSGLQTIPDIRTRRSNWTFNGLPDKVSSAFT